MPSTQLALLARIVLPVSSGNLELIDFRLTTTALELFIANRSVTAACPACGRSAYRVHSRYRRRLEDLPCSGRRVQIHWQIRRFFCDEPCCSQTTFAEQLPDLAARYARVTRRLASKLHAVGFEAGGEAGKRMSALFDIPASADQLLRRVKTARETARPTPRVLGIDDWSKRKRHFYGTILVDLERNQVMDLLPDRKPETISAWLQAHPGVEVISRDRWQDYIDGINRVLPGVVQVADRFHLMKNLQETVQRMFEHTSSVLKAADRAIFSGLAAVSTAPPELPAPVKLVKTRRQLLFEEVKVLQAEGVKQRAIARRLGLSRQTVRKYFTLTSPPSKQGVGASPKTANYLDYLRKRLDDGNANFMELFAEMRTLGFRGSYSAVYRAAHRQGGSGRNRSKRSAQARPISPKQAAWALFQPQSSLKGYQLSMREALCHVSELAIQARDLVEAFRVLMASRREENLEAWLLQAERSAIPEFVGLAAGFRRDLAAIRAGISSPWSNGQVEGQINRLKLIKRQMYGRAGFELLRRRVLGPAPFS